jgi:hypothetical protein
MALFMRDSGKIIYTMGVESFIMPVEIYTKENSLTTWPKVLESTSTPMVASMSATGIKTNSMVSVRKSGTMAVNIKVSTKMLPKRVKVSIAGPMEIDMLVSGKSICSTVRVSSFGMMIDFILESGKIT